MDDADPDDDRRDRIAELEAAIDDLRRELDRERDRPGARRPGPLDWMRRTTTEVGIPATIAVLESNVRLLESLQRELRRDAATTARPPMNVDRARESSFDAIDRALADVQSAVERGGFPGQPEARRLLQEARRLNAEIRQGTETRPTRPVDDGEGAVTIDVEAELDEIRDEVDDEDG